MSGIELPDGWQTAPLASPPIVYRAWAGEYAQFEG